MNSVAKFAIATAAVVAVALIGINLLPGSGVGTGTPAPSPTPEVTPSAAAASDSPEASTAVLPEYGSLQAGTHYTLERGGTSLEVTFPVDGWRGTGPWMAAHEGTPESTELSIEELVGTPGIFTDPCAHEGYEAFDDSAAGDAQAIASLGGVDVIEPPATTTVDGRPAQTLTVIVPADVPCMNTLYWIKHDPTCGVRIDCTYYPTWLGGTMRHWYVDLDVGRRLAIVAQTHPDAGPGIADEIQQVVDSIRIE